MSRSKHKIQGFGSTGSRGSQIEFLEHLEGDRAEKDLFEGIDMTWARVKGGEEVQSLIEKSIADYNPNFPEKCIENLILVKNTFNKLKAGFWKSKKSAEVDQLILWCCGPILHQPRTGHQDKYGSDQQIC